MVAVSNKPTDNEPTRLDRVLAMKPTPRVERLREAFVRLKPTASIERARIETRVMKETEGEPMITRRAKVFAAVVKVAGYNAIFVELTKPLQDSIIARTEHRL